MLYETYNFKSKHLIRNYPFLIVGKEEQYYKIKSDTPLDSKGNPKYDAQYLWNNTDVYIPSSIKNLVIVPATSQNTYLKSLDNPANGAILSGKEL